MNPEFTIMRATTAQIELAQQAIREVHRRSLADESALEEFLSDRARYLLLAIENAGVVGSLNGYALRPAHQREPQFLLYEIDVRPECRRRGVGTALVEQFIAQARSAGASEVWVLTEQSNNAAMSLYERCGMRRPNRDDVMWSLNLI